MHFVIPAFALFLYMCVLFVISLVRRDNGTADIGYGIGFMVVAAVALYTSSFTFPAAILSALPFIWGTRLALRIYVKNRGKPEDFRYKAWRDAWGSSFVIRSFFQVYVLQGAVIYSVSLPILLAVSMPGIFNPALFLLGILLWSVGFVFETVADFQLDRFIGAPENKGRIMKSGLWAFSRHPNYFGESTMWWGIAISAAGLSSLPVLGFVSPLLITFLLLFVSGVPLLEKRWEGNPEWEDYKARTSVFIPFPPRPKA